MYWQTYEDDDGNDVDEFDVEAIDYLIAGLQQLRDLAPGDELTTPTFSEKDGTLVAAKRILRLVETGE